MRIPPLYAAAETWSTDLASNKVMFLGQDPDSGYSPPMIKLGLEGSFPFFKIFPDLIYSYEGSLDSSIYLRSDRDLT